MLLNGNACVIVTHNTKVQFFEWAADDFADFEFIKFCFECVSFAQTSSSSFRRHVAKSQ